MSDTVGTPPVAPVSLSIGTSATTPGLQLRLYVAGHAPNSVQAIKNATAACDQHFASDYALEIVDLNEQPLRALDDGIVVTPTLLKIHPPPAQRVVGNLSDTPQLLIALGHK